MNQNNYLMENAVITDTYEPVRLNYGTQFVGCQRYNHWCSVDVRQGFHGEITRNADGETGFKVSFIGAYAKTSDAFHITYTTFSMLPS